jgi:hypothetical protein
MRRLVKDLGVGGSGVGFRGVGLSVLGVGGSDISLSGVGLTGLGVSGPGVGLSQDGVSGVGLSGLGISLLGDSLLGVSSIGEVCFGSHNDTSLGGAFSIKSSLHSTISSLPVWIGDGISRLLPVLSLKLILSELEYEMDVDKAASTVLSVLSLLNALSSSAGFN